MIPAALRKWAAIGSGVGIHIDGPGGAESLHICAARVRPSGVAVRGGFTIEDFTHQPAGVWGTDYAAFLRKLGLAQSIATVILPRKDVIVRTLSLPGVSDKDLAGAVAFQLDSIHPYDEGDVVSGWTRLPGTSTVLVAVSRRAAIERYAALFAEAGVRVNAFTCSPVAIYSALRLRGEPARANVLAIHDGANGIEVYGESAARPIYSTKFEADVERAIAHAAAELRIEAPEPKRLAELLGADPPIPYAAAVIAACPWLGLPLNLLPAGQRENVSPLRWIPSAAVAAVALMLAGALAAFSGYESRRYAQVLETQIAQAQPGAGRAAALDREIDAIRKRTQLLDELRRRPKADMDVLAEMTRVLAPPAWLNLIEISQGQVIVGGEIDQSAPLLKSLDSSPMFQASEFVSPPLRIVGGEMFRIRTNRRAGK